MQDRTLPTAKSPADVDRIIEYFHKLYGRTPNAEELSTFEYIRQLLMDKHSSSMKAAADD